MFYKRKSNKMQLEKLLATGLLEYDMSQNSPNPVINKTKICFSIPTAGIVKIAVYNRRGEEQCVLFKGHLEPGSYGVIWNGKNAYNQRLRPGIYNYLLQSGAFVATRQLIIQ